MSAEGRWRALCQRAERVAGATHAANATGVPSESGKSRVPRSSAGNVAWDWTLYFLWRCTRNLTRERNAGISHVFSVFFCLTHLFLSDASLLVDSLCLSLFLSCSKIVNDTRPVLCNLSTSLFPSCSLKYRPASAILVVYTLHATSPCTRLYATSTGVGL